MQLNPHLSDQRLTISNDGYLEPIWSKEPPFPLSFVDILEFTASEDSDGEEIEEMKVSRYL